MSGFRSFRGRPAPYTGMRCRVYRNLNLEGFFSILADEGDLKGRVLGYARAVCLTDVKFKVLKAGYERLHRERVRNVHAMALGRFKQCADEPAGELEVRAERITYHPFLQPFFFYRNYPKTPVWAVDEAWAFGSDMLVPG